MSVSQQNTKTANSFQMRTQIKGQDEGNERGVMRHSQTSKRRKPSPSVWVEGTQREDGVTRTQ